MGSKQRLPETTEYSCPHPGRLKTKMFGSAVKVLLEQGGLYLGNFQKVMERMDLHVCRCEKDEIRYWVRFLFLNSLTEPSLPAAPSDLEIYVWLAETHRE